MESAMQDTTEASEDKLQLAKSLVDCLESGDENQAVSVIAQLAGFRDSLLFQEVGRLTRELHDSINSFVADAKLANIVHNEMPDATERLRYVIATTEKAANTTLGAVEESLPLADSLRADARHLAEQWSKFNSRQLSVDDFRALSSELGGFLEATEANSSALHDKLSEVLMAQGYQDLTGQVIRKVIDLVNDVEVKLVELVRLSGQPGGLSKDKQPVEKNVSADGPFVPGVDHGDVVSGQDDVDDLLSSLGF
jgi:chemotaxis protein CheZ